jgi:hypothetical protein
MRRLLEFSLEDGGSIIVEVEDLQRESGLAPAARSNEVVTKVSQTFEAAIERLKPAAGAIIAKVRSLNDPPNEIEVEFGLKLSAEAGAVLAVASTEANYKVTLKWKQG